MMNDAAAPNNVVDLVIPRRVAHDITHNLYQRLNAVQREARYVAKDKNVDNKYNVATYDAVLEIARDSLIEHGVAVETTLVESNTFETGMVSSKGGKWLRYEGVFDIIFINIDRPEDRTTVRVGAFAEDLGDKGPGKAQTYATKAALKKQLLIRTGDDEEERVGSGADGDKVIDKETGEITERVRPAAKAETAAAAEVKKAAGGKIASAGEITFAKTKLKTPEAIAAFCTSIGIESIDKLPEGGGKLVTKYLTAQAS